MADIEIEQVEGVLRIRINRPAKRNALTVAMYLAMADAIEAAGADPSIGCILIHAEGDIFTAGNDIADFLDRPPGPEEDGVIRFLKCLVSARKPLIAAVRGDAIGVGATLLLHCDLVVAGESSMFRSPFTDLGLVPEAGSTYLLPLMVGYRHAASLLMLGDPWTAADALTAGLVSHVCLDTAVLDVAEGLADRLAAKPATAVVATKELLRSGFREATLQQMEREAIAFAEAVKSDATREIFRRFLQRSSSSA